MKVKEWQKETLKVLAGTTLLLLVGSSTTKWIATATEERERTNRPMATVVGAVNSIVNDENAERIYLLPVNYNLPRANRWLELRPPSVIRFSEKDTPIELTEPVGITFFGTKGSYNLKISLYFKGNLESECHKPHITEEVIDNLIKIRFKNRWQPMLFCNAKKPQPIENVYRILNANLPGNYTIQVNGQTIGTVDYTLESNEINLNLYQEKYNLKGVTQILLFTKPEEIN